MKSKQNCPAIPILPGASSNLMKYITDILRDCAGLKIYHSKRFNRRQYNSAALLEIEPGLVLVDGSDQSRISAGKAIDTFLAAHSVMVVAWEPIYPTDPLWWVLIPRPKGMPGHLFAIIDAIQYKHPLVSKADSYHHEKNCTIISGRKNCVPGCPGTRMKRFIVSGYNADTAWVVDGLRKSVVVNIPFQAAPVMLGYRAVPPLWGGTLGWGYTYGACPSNFLDCFFLAHSPCPPIDIEPVEGPVRALVDPDRVSNRPIRVPADPSWFIQAVGSGRDYPDNSVGTLTGNIATHVFFSHLFRPNYRIREQVQIRVDAFALPRDSCAVMHVRRGDSVIHRSQGRAYIAIDAYVRAARPLMDAMGLKTILLLTDSRTAVEEALRCESEHPEVCRGIRWRYIDKARWRGAEGGWENPFPSGNATEEFLVIQLEFSLAQQCSMLIAGDSGYAEKLQDHMCCSSPVSPRGYLPSRCVCPPKVQLSQWDFNCHSGNKILCGNKDVGGNIHKKLGDPTNMLGANFSFTADAFRKDPGVAYSSPGMKPVHIPLHKVIHVPRELKDFVRKAVDTTCKYRKLLDRNLTFCSF